MARTHTWSFGQADETDSEAIDMHLDNNAVTQISCIDAHMDREGRTGFMIRVWPTNGTYEYGGTNSTLMIATILFEDDGTPVLSGFQYHGPLASLENI